MSNDNNNSNKINTDNDDMTNRILGEGKNRHVRKDIFTYLLSKYN